MMKQNIIGFVFAIGCVFCDPTTGFVQELTLNNIDEAIKLALEKNPDYQNFILNQEQAKLEYKQSKSYRLPSITGSVSGQRNIDLATTPLPAEIFGGEPGQTINAQFGQEYAYNAGLSISKQLFNRELILQSKLAELNTQRVDVEKAQYEQFLEQSVSLYYFTALVSKKAVDVSMQDVESAMKITELAKDRYEQGLIDLIAYNQSRINENVVRQNLSSNQQLLDECLVELKKLLGISYQEKLWLSEDIDYELPTIFREDQLEPDLSIKSASVQMDQADMNTKLSRSSLLPSLSLNSYFGRQQFRDDFGLAFGGDSWTNYSYLSVNLSIPIFAGFNNRREITKSKINSRIIQNQKEETEQVVKLEDQLLIKNYQSSLSDAALAKDNYLLYEANQRLTYEKYEEGLVSLDTYLRTFEDYVKAENAYLNSISKVYSLYSQIIPRI